MQIITKNGHFTSEHYLIHRLEPWRTPQEVPDNLFDEMATNVIFVVPPAGMVFREGVTAADWPTKADLIPEEGISTEVSLEDAKAAAMARAAAKTAE